MSYDLEVTIPGTFNAPALQRTLEPLGAAANGEDGFVIASGQTFVAIERNKPHAVSVSVCYGGGEDEIRAALDAVFALGRSDGATINDPQLDRRISSESTADVVSSWFKNDLTTLQRYADGYHFIREVVSAGGKLVMLEAQRFSGQSAANYSSVAVGFARVGEFKRALALFEKANALEPRRPDVLYSIALTYWDLGDLQRAEEYAKKALAADPSYEQATAMLNELRHE